MHRQYDDIEKSRLSKPVWPTFHGLLTIPVYSPGLVFYVINPG